MSRPILYSFRRCPYAIRARLALHQAGVAVELREVVLRNKPAEMLAISPKGTVPVLQQPDGRVIDESLDIMRWALDQHDADGWLMQGEADEQAALIALNDAHFKPLLDRYKYSERFPEKSQAEWRAAAIDCLMPLERQLSGRDYFFGTTPSLADAAIFPFVRQFAGVDAEAFAGAPLPRLQDWLAGWLFSPCFKAVMGKHVPWRPQDAASGASKPVA